MAKRHFLLSRTHHTYIHAYVCVHRHNNKPQRDSPSERNRCGSPVRTCAKFPSARKRFVFLFHLRFSLSFRRKWLEHLLISEKWKLPLLPMLHCIRLVHNIISQWIVFIIGLVWCNDSMWMKANDWWIRISSSESYVVDVGRRKRGRCELTWLRLSNTRRTHTHTHIDLQFPILFARKLLNLFNQSIALCRIHADKLTHRFINTKTISLYLPRLPSCLSLSLPPRGCRFAT